MGTVNLLNPESRKFIAALVVASFVLLAGGCAQVVVPVGDVTTSTPSPQTTPVPSSGEGSHSGEASRHDANTTGISEPAGDVIVPNRPAQQVSGGAVAKLIEDAWRYNRSGEYDRSNAVAERAMRIDHTEPEIYLVMASNYFAVAQLRLAEQLASQGLPLASDNYAVKRGLQQLLVDIRTKMP